MYCIHCGTANPDAAAFCSQCGRPLKPAPALPATTGKPFAPPKPVAARNWRPWITAAAILVGLLIVGTAGALAGRAWLHIGTNEAADLMPVQTLILVHVSPGPLQIREVQKLQGLGALLPTTRSEFGSATESLSDIDPNRDILSWMGMEAALGLVNNTERPVSSGGSPDLLLAVATRNKSKSAALLDKVRAELEAEEIALRDQVYQGVSVVWQDPEGLAYAQFKGFVVVGSSRDVVQQAIDAAYGLKSPLAKATSYQRVLRNLPKRSAGFIYVDWNRVSATNLLGDLQSSIAQQVGDAREFGLSLSFEGGGARFDTVLGQQEQQSSRSTPEAASGPNRALAQAPRDSVACISGRNLRGDIDERLLSLGYDGREAEDELDRFLAENLGFGLNQYLLNWSEGDYALTLVSDPEGLADEEGLPLAVAVVLQMRDTPSARRSTDQAARYLEQQTGSQFVEEIIDDQAFNTLTWKTSGRERTIGYGFRDGFLLLGSSQVALRQLTGRATGLDKAPLYRQVKAQLPDRQGICLYGDLQTFVDTYYETLDGSDQDLFDKQVRPYVESIRAIGLANNQDNSSEALQGSLFIVLGTNNQRR